MSAGSGVWHSEFNLGEVPLRLLQIWILPNAKGLKPQYGEYKFPWQSRKNQWLHMVGSLNSQAPIQVHQDVNLYAIYLEAGQSHSLAIGKDRQAYAVLIEGKIALTKSPSLEVASRDALVIVGENFEFHCQQASHLLVIEMSV